MSGSIKLKHASGNGVSITAPSSNPAADRTLELPSDADGVIAKTDASGNLAVTGDLTVDTSTLKVDSSNNRVYVGNTGLGATAEADDLVVGNLTGGHGITIHSQNNEGGFICFGDADTTGVDSRRGVIRYQHSDDSMRFGLAGNNEKMRILANGGITFNGDTAAANALNDYEEGYWSPTAMDGIPITTNNTGNHPSRRYIKIGKIVFAYFDFTFGNQFNAFGARFGGLPITVASGGGHGANASTNGYTNLQQEYFLHVSGTNPAIFKSNGAQFTHNEVSSKKFAGCLIYSTD